MRRPAAAVVAALLALAAGCGGGGGERLSRDAYVAKADAICREAARKEKALPVPASIAGIPSYVDRFLPIVDAGVRELRALRPPREMEHTVNEWLKSIGEARGRVADLRRAAESGDANKVREVGSKANELNKRSNSLASSIGLTDCANT